MRYFCKDILEGIDDTGVKAGVIGEVASGEPQMRPSEKNVLTAAAMAGKKTGVAVTTHCQLGKLAQEQIEIFEQQGMDLTRVVLGHLDLANDRDYYEKILKTGVNIGFDTIGKTAYLSDEQRADNLLWLIERGWEKQIVLSQDISRKSYLSRGGKYSGYMTVMKDFVPLLRARGIKQETLNRFLIENPARILIKQIEVIITKTYPLKSLTVEEATELQFYIVDCITRNMSGREMLSRGDLGVVSGKINRL